MGRLSSRLSGLQCAGFAGVALTLTVAVLVGVELVPGEGRWPAAIAAAVALLCAWDAWRQVSVELVDGEELVLRRLDTRVRLPLHEVSAVERRGFGPFERVALHLLRETPWGRCVVFRPTWRLVPVGTHPVVEPLRDLVWGAHAALTRTAVHGLHRMQRRASRSGYARSRAVAVSRRQVA